MRWRHCLGVIPNGKGTKTKGYPKLKNYKPSQFMLPTSRYDKKKADRAVTFIENLCHTKGKWAGTPFWLLPWQEQLIRDIFGIVKPDGNRQFRTAFVEICKKVGKSELAAAVALYLLYADNEPYYEYLVYDGDDVDGRTGTDPKANGKIVRLHPADVLHIPGLGFDGLVGYSPIAMAKNAIGLAIAAEEYGSKFYANGAAPSGVLEHPGTLKDPGRVRESWQSTFGGSSNANKVAVLEEGMKYTPISIAPNEAQFLETRKFQIDEIARIFRVPPHMVGDLDKSSFSNIEQQSLEFVKYTLDPWVSRWEQAMVRALLSAEEKKKYFFKFNVDGLLRGDYQSRMTGYATARQNGWMSANDIRELENMDRIPEELGGDLYLINGNMTKLQDAGIFAGSGKGKDTGEEVLELEENENGESGNRTGSG